MTTTTSSSSLTTTTTTTTTMAVSKKESIGRKLEDEEDKDNKCDDPVVPLPHSKYVSPAASRKRFLENYLESFRSSSSLRRLSSTISAEEEDSAQLPSCTSATSFSFTERDSDSECSSSVNDEFTNNEDTHPDGQKQQQQQQKQSSATTKGDPFVETEILLLLDNDNEKLATQLGQILAYQAANTFNEDEEDSSSDDDADDDIDSIEDDYGPKQPQLQHLTTESGDGGSNPFAETEMLLLMENTEKELGNMMGRATTNNSTVGSRIGEQEDYDGDASILNYDTERSVQSEAEVECLVVFDDNNNKFDDWQGTVLVNSSPEEQQLVESDYYTSDCMESERSTDGRRLTILQKELANAERGNPFLETELLLSQVNVDEGLEQVFAATPSRPVITMTENDEDDTSVEEDDNDNEEHIVAEESKPLEDHEQNAGFEKMEDNEKVGSGLDGENVGKHSGEGETVQKACDKNIRFEDNQLENNFDDKEEYGGPILAEEAVRTPSTPVVKNNDKDDAIIRESHSDENKSVEDETNKDGDRLVEDDVVCGLEAEPWEQPHQEEITPSIADINADEVEENVIVVEEDIEENISIAEEEDNKDSKEGDESGLVEEKKCTEYPPVSVSSIFHGSLNQQDSNLAICARSFDVPDNMQTAVCDVSKEEVFANCETASYFPKFFLVILMVMAAAYIVAGPFSESNMVKEHYVTPPRFGGETATRDAGANKSLSSRLDFPRSNLSRNETFGSSPTINVESKESMVAANRQLDEIRASSTTMETKTTSAFYDQPEDSINNVPQSGRGAGASVDVAQRPKIKTAAPVLVTFEDDNESIVHHPCSHGISFVCAMQGFSSLLPFRKGTVSTPQDDIEPESRHQRCSHGNAFACSTVQPLLKKFVLKDTTKEDSWAPKKCKHGNAFACSTMTMTKGHGLNDSTRKIGFITR